MTTMTDDEILARAREIKFERHRRGVVAALSKAADGDIRITWPCLESGRMQRSARVKKDVALRILQEGYC